MKHFKKTEKGREIMCEAVEKYGDKRAKEAAKEVAKEAAKEATRSEKLNSVKSLMENMKFSLEQALNALGIKGDERVIIMKQLQK